MSPAEEQGLIFLATNAENDGVTVTESGLQYLVLDSGDGKQPQAIDTVTVHYEGKLLDGSIFDSSYERGQHISFPVNGVIAGWQEALQLMHEGDKWQVFIPADLAYGSRGAGADIGPDETLIFIIELISVG